MGEEEEAGMKSENEKHIVQKTSRRSDTEGKRKREGKAIRDRTHRYLPHAAANHMSTRSINEIRQQDLATITINETHQRRFIKETPSKKSVDPSARPINEIHQRRASKRSVNEIHQGDPSTRSIDEIYQRFPASIAEKCASKCAVQSTLPATILAVVT